MWMGGNNDVNVQEVDGRKEGKGEERKRKEGREGNKETSGEGRRTGKNEEWSSIAWMIKWNRESRGGGGGVNERGSAKAQGTQKMVI